MSSYRLLLGGYDNQIHTVHFRPDHDSEKLKITSSQACGKAPTWLTLAEDGKTVYCLDEWASDPSGEVTALAVDEIGQLTKLTTVSTGGLWPCHSVLLPSVEPPRLIATNYKGASIASIPLHASGDLDLTSSSFSRIEYLGTRSPGPHKSRQTQDHPHGAHLDPRTGTLLVIPDLGTDDLRLIGIKPDGNLEELQEVHMKDGDGPRHCIFSANGERLYVLNELDNSISVYQGDYPPPPVLGKLLPTHSNRYPTLTPLQLNVSLLPSEPFPHQKDFSSWHAAELILSPSGQTLYASNRAEGHNPLHPPRSDCSDLLAIFPLDSSNGKLVEEERELVEIGGRCPRHFELIGESGEWLVVVCHDSDEVIVFERQGEDGRELEEVARLGDCGKPAVVVCLP